MFVSISRTDEDFEPIINNKKLEKMKKLLVLLACVAGFASCGVRLIPESVNTIDRAPLADLNLQRSDYEILNTITAEASVICHNISKSKRMIKDLNGEFSVKWKKPKLFHSRGTSAWVCKNFQGVLRTGALYDLPAKTADHADPLDMAQRLALYRVINLAQQQGADAIIEPSYKVDIAQSGKAVTYKATVVAKIIKIKTNR